MELRVKVKHAIGTTDNEVSGGSLNYWEEAVGILPSSKPCPCCKRTHSKTDFVGAHVVDMFGINYITPTCRFCNSTYKNSKAITKWFEVVKNELVTIE